MKRVLKLHVQLFVSGSHTYNFSVNSFGSFVKKMYFQAFLTAFCMRGYEEEIMGRIKDQVVDQREIHFLQCSTTLFIPPKKSDPVPVLKHINAEFLPSSPFYYVACTSYNLFSLDTFFEIALKWKCSAFNLTPLFLYKTRHLRMWPQNPFFFRLDPLMEKIIDRLINDQNYCQWPWSLLFFVKL